MDKFKKGDKVRRYKYGSSRISVGSEHIVTGYDKYGLLLVGSELSWTDDYFELVKEEKPVPKANPCIIPPSATVQLITGTIDAGTGYVDIKFPNTNTVNLEHIGYFSKRELKEFARQLSEIAEEMD